MFTLSSISLKARSSASERLPCGMHQKSYQLSTRKASNGGLVSAR